MNKGKIILIVLLVGALTGAGVGIYMWNKPHEQIEDVQGMEVSVSDLAGEFSHLPLFLNCRYYLLRWLLAKNLQSYRL